MENYSALVNIVISHDYFSDGICRVIEFRPTHATAVLIRQNNLLLKPSLSGLSIFGDFDAHAKIDEPIRLRYFAYSTDPNFSIYTAKSGQDDGQLYFSTMLVQQQKLIPSTFHCDENDEDLPNPKQIVKPVFIVDVNLTESIFSSSNTKKNEFFIHFKANMLRWKYYFLGDLASFDLEIYDLNAISENVFTSDNNREIHNCRTFLSKESIVLSDTPKQRFQLKDKNNSGKVLIKRLPNAGVSRMGKELGLDGKLFIVAEIYVNQ